MTGVHAPALGRLGLSDGDAGRLGAYLDRLAAWNARVNLTGATDPDTRV